MRAGLIFFAFGCIFQLLCQSSPAQGELDPEVYRLFFQAAVAHAAVTTESRPIGLNGQLAVLSRFSVQDTLGVTDQEAQSVLTASAGCEQELGSLADSARALVFESRLLAANEEKPSEDIANRLKELDTKRTQIILSHLQRMKDLLGAERFKIVDNYIHTHAGNGGFFPSGAPRKL